MQGIHRTSDQSIRAHAVSLLVSVVTCVGAVASSGCCLPQAIRATCQPYENLKEQTVLKVRARRLAKEVWATRQAACYQNQPYADAVRQGFEQAYVETAIGMRGCPPPVPTRRLISVESITHTYPAAGPWYEGYSIGHASAVSRGVDRWRLAPIDPALAAAYAAQQACYSRASMSVGLKHEVDAEPEPELAPDAEAPEPIPLPPEEIEQLLDEVDLELDT